MPFDFAFHSVQSSSDIRRTIDFLAKQDLAYPGYSDWVAKAEAELFSGYKRAGLAYSNGILVGDIIWQQDKELTRVREIKNIRVSPEARGRYLAHFLLRQAEAEENSEFDAVICDARETQTGLIALMQDMGYQILGSVNLYEEDRKDVVLFKSIGRNAQPS